MQCLGQSIPDWDPREAVADPANNGAFPNLQSNLTNMQGLEVNPTQNSVRINENGATTSLATDLQDNTVSDIWDNGDWMTSILDDQGLMDDSLFGLFTPGEPAFDFTI